MNQVTPGPQMQSPSSGYREAIIRASADPKVDIDKLERLIAIQKEFEDRQALALYNQSLADAQREMATISNDAANPMTHSRYATFARLDGAIRPIYTKHGFGIQFDEEDCPDVTKIRVVGYLSCGGHVKRFKRDIPWTTQGIRGQAMSTPTHANMSAVTYGRRSLLVMMFNLATSDDDGNAAGGRRNAPPRKGGRISEEALHRVHDPNGNDDSDVQSPGQPSQPQSKREPPKPVEPSGMPPHAVSRETDQPWQEWGAQFIAEIRHAADDTERDEWVHHNRATLELFKQESPRMYANLENAVFDAMTKGEDT